MTLSKLGGDKMNKKNEIIVNNIKPSSDNGSTVFANQGVLRNHRFLQGTGRQTNIENSIGLESL